MTFILICVLTVILLLALLLSLGLQPRSVTRITGYLLLFAAGSGILLYGYGYSVLFDDLPQAVIRTLFSVFCMFLGRNEISAISAAPLLKSPGMQLFLYAVHLLALYCTASAVAATIGVRLIRILRLLLVRRGNLHLIYGTGEDAVAFGEKLLQRKEGYVLFADAGGGAVQEGKILRMGSLLFTGEEAGTPSTAFLKKLGMKPGKRRLTLYCLADKPADNYRYAEAMRVALRQAEILPEQIGLVILLEEEDLGASLQAVGGGGEGAYGYGSVFTVERAELLARLMIKMIPPFRTLSFDENAQAEEDFEALIVGFGRTGQAVLRSLIRNGQFEGSSFHATVLSRDHRQQSGSFFSRYPGLCQAYRVDFLDADARSVAVYEHLTAQFRHLNYVVVCTGDEKENGEIAEELSRFLADRGIQPPILLCSARGVSQITDRGSPSGFTGLFAPEVLCSGGLDAMAAVINHRYHAAEGRSVSADWAACDYFSRMSCRASADFLDAYLYAAGTDRGTVLREGWQPEAETFETLSRTEHLRWCAFHYAMGWQPMPESVFEERADCFRLQVRQAGTGSIRITKDPERKLHACLIPWEELDDLADRELAVTGKRPDYKEMDRNNLRTIPEMLRAEQALKGG